MATGTSAGFWDEEKSPALLKHEILGRYVPPFLAKLGKTWGKVVLLDGYAGAGRYTSGAPGSALQMAEIAGNLVSKLKISVDVYLIERETETIDFLRNEIGRLPKIEGLEIHVMEGDIAEKFEEVITAAHKLPLFIFLDPCGLGLPFSKLTNALSQLRPVAGPGSAPTEVLLNFSADAVRRIGGQVNSASSGPTALSRMDDTVGGEWWRDFYRGSFDKELAETHVVDGYTERLGNGVRMYMQAVPVRRDIGHRPVYYLVFGTRHRHGAWYFADSVARSTANWQRALESRRFTGQLSFEGFGATVEEQLIALEDSATAAISNNLLAILDAHGDFMVGDYPIQVFGDYLGLVREQVVRMAIKSLHTKNLVSSPGTGSPIYELRVTRPT